MTAHYLERLEAMPEKRPPYDERLAQIMEQLALIAAELARLTAETKRLADAAHGPFGGAK